MGLQLVVGEQSEHLESQRIGRFLDMTVQQEHMNTARRQAQLAGADSMEAAYVRIGGDSSPAIGLRKGSELIGYVPTESAMGGVFVDLTAEQPDDFRYNKGPDVRIQEI